MDSGGAIPSCAQQLEVFVCLHLFPLSLGGRVGCSELFPWIGGVCCLERDAARRTLRFRGIPLNTSHAVTCRFLQMLQRSCLLIFVSLSLIRSLCFQEVRDGWLVIVVLLLFIFSLRVLILVCAQDCIASRASLEGRMAKLVLQNEALEEELSSWRLHGGPDAGLLTTLGISDAVLMLLLVGGVLWRHFYGPAGPVYPIDR
jgi:hypothetical protein